METNLEQQSPKLNVTNVSSAVFGKEGSALGKESKIGKLSRIVRTTRLKVNEVEKILPEHQQIIGSSAKKIKINEEKIAKNTEKITRLKNILQNQKSKIGEKLPGSTEEKEKAKLNTTLTETNRILVEIQKQLAYDFAMRAAEDKKEVAEEKEATSKERFKREESALEKSAKAMVSTVKTATKKIVSPIGNIFEKLLAFIGILAKGIAVNAAFDWFKDPKNREKITKFFNILKENWQLLAKILGVIAGAILIGKIIGFIGAMSKLVGFIVGPLATALKTAITLLTNPFFIAGVGVAIAAVDKSLGGDLSAVLQEVKDSGDGVITRENINASLKKREDYLKDPKFKGFAGFTNQVERQRVEREVVFLKSGFYGGIGTQGTVGAPKPLDWEFLIKSSKFGDVGVDFFGNTTVEPRAMGGPVTAGKTYLVGERGPELVKFSENGQVINNMQTEKIYQMISSGKKGRTRIVELPPQTIEGPKPEIKMPRGPATKAPKISSSNSLDGYRSVSSGIYGIMV